MSMYSVSGRVFLSTPSARRATYQLKAAGGYKIFLSTPSARRATDLKHKYNQKLIISIHALREEGDGLPSSPKASR